MSRMARVPDVVPPMARVALRDGVGAVRVADGVRVSTLTVRGKIWIPVRADTFFDSGARVRIVALRGVSVWVMPRSRTVVLDDFVSGERVAFCVGVGADFVVGAVRDVVVGTDALRRVAARAVSDASSANAA